MRQKPKIKKPLGAGRCNATKKTIYLTEANAHKGLTLIWGADPSADINDLHVYRCEHCGFFHVGHMSSYIKYLEKNGQTKQLPDLRGQTVSN